MVFDRIPHRLLKFYLMRSPVAVRPARFERLEQWPQLRRILAEIRSEVLPADPEADKAQPPAQTDAIAPEGIQPSALFYQQYRCRFGNPLNCRLALPDQASITQCECGFPAGLAEKRKLQGRKGSYQIGKCLGQRGIGRIYSGTQLGVEQPVTIKEYLLPDLYFNDAGRRQQQNQFKNLTSLGLADRRNQEMRLIVPFESFVDESTVDDRAGRCYLITPELDSCPTLSQVLTNRTQWPILDLYELLNQVLQTLECLHEQKFALSLGQVKVNLNHGNLSLNSLLWVTQGNHRFVYLTDLALWEQLFDPASIQASPKTYKDDLVDLGKLAFHLSERITVDQFGQPIDSELKGFIQRLMKSEFANARSARQALLNLRRPQANALSANSVQRSARRSNFLYYVILFILAVLLTALAGLVWALQPKPAISTSPPPLLCCIKDVTAVPGGTFTYVSLASSSWSDWLKRPSAQAAQVANPPSLDATHSVVPPTLTTAIQTAQPDLILKHDTVPSVAAAIEAIRTRQADFAVLPLVEDLPRDLQSQPIGFDGLAVFVAFSYALRSQGLPVGLNGQITIPQLQQLYQGKIDNWTAFSRSNLRVKRYAPIDPTAQTLFERQVLQDENAIAEFRQQLETQTIQRLRALEMLRSILRDFETNRDGGIGFAPFSEIFGQCSVYPLAIANPPSPPVQVLHLNSGQAITPDLNLCSRKGSYQVQLSLLQNSVYPLAYPIAVVYPFDNRRSPIGRKFAEMMNTQQGQDFLSLSPKNRQLD